MKTLLLSALLFLIPITASAGSVTSTFRVSVTVVADCTINTQDLAFPNYSASSTSQATTNLSVTCTRGTPATVTTTSPMQLTDGTGDMIQYQLLSAQGQSMASGFKVVGQGPHPITVPVQGVIPAGQHVPPGLYQGEQVVTVVF